MSNNIIKSNLFKEIIGQKNAISILRSAINHEHIAPAYLFSGPNGVGKKLTVFKFVEGLLGNGNPSERVCQRITRSNHPDLLWIEPTYSNQGKLVPQSIAEREGINRRNPSQIRLDQIRSITRFLSKEPVEAQAGVVVIESAEKMGEASSSALLKTLEEPGKGILILITARPESLLETIRSRCQQIPFTLLNSKDMTRVMKQIQSEKELINKYSGDLQNQFKKKVITRISNGSPGAYLENLNIWETIPEELWPNIQSLPKEPIECLSFARNLTDALDCEQQIWLLNLLQNLIWDKTLNSQAIKRLDKLRSHLLSFVQPRLAWEVALLEINQALARSS